MKTPRLLPLGASLLLALLPVSSFGQAPIRIMPVGDSITNGSSVPGGYRDRLYSLLTADGYNVDFVGSVTTNPSGTLPDSDHEGHGGWRIDQIDTNIEGFLGGILDPDVMLLHIGTNDFGQGVDTLNAINRLDDLITKMATLRPHAHIIVTNLMERGEPQNAAIVAQFNPFVQDKVNAQAALGRKVTFLDMRSAVPLSEMPDNLHPNKTGYDHMADAWEPAIQAVIGVNGDNYAPEIVRAVANPDLTHVDITFSKPVDDSAATPGFYAIDGGLSVSAAVLDADKRVVTLTTSEQTSGVAYTATVNGVVDRTAGLLALAANSTVAFNGATQSGYENNIPESDCYTLVYSLDIPNTANYSLQSVPYSIDTHATIGTYDRVAYYMELQTPGGGLQYAWTSMDAFDTNAAHIGVPSLATGVTFQQSVANLNVLSNVPGVTTGEGQTGNLEFWPTNYNQANSAGVTGANGTTYDFGDNPTPGNHGSMQIHNTSAAQSVISLTRWGGSAGDVGIGIGNQPTGEPDWNFADNAADFSLKKLQVLVRTTGDLTPPTLVSAEAGFGGQTIILQLSEPVRPDTIEASNFTLDNGVTVLSATAGDDLSRITLTTTAQPAAALTLTVGNLRDTSQNANEIAPASMIAVAAAALPAEVVANIAAAANGYELVYSLDIPVTGNFNAAGIPAYTIDNSANGGAFSRIAYYLELQSGATTSYIWTSMDAFTTDKRKIGVPTFATGAIFQQPVTNLDVISNKGGITNSTGIATGNIEFWPHSYSAGNALAVANASGTLYDWGDTRSTSGNYGSMQVHNNGASQTLFALNRWGADGLALDVGIGNDPTPTNNGKDWTFANNAGTEYSRRTLHVMVLPAPLPTPIIANVPEAADYELVYSLNLPATGTLSGVGTGFVDYTFNDKARTAPFSRIAYYLELQKTGDPAPTYVWVSMDAFTSDRGKIGVPTVASGALWQRLVTNMNVVSNSPNITNGIGITTGNIEFWPGNYNGTNPLGIPNASGSAFDFGDGAASGTYGHGSMQIHNHDIDGAGPGTAGQTLFAINRWGGNTNGTTSNPLCIGIGNNPAPTNNDPDWTFANNAGSYDLLKRLHVLVLPGASPAQAGGLAFVGAVGSTTLDRLVVTFDREVSAGSADPANFSIDGGLTVTGATLLPGNREIALTTSPQTGGTLYTVSAPGVQARAGGFLLKPGATTQFSAYTPPAALANVPGTDTGNELIYQLAIPAAQPRWNINPITYNINEAKYGEQVFDRVAYLLELDGDWAYVSFDPHSNQLAQIGVPNTASAPNPFFQFVTTMNVASNVAGVVTGTGIATGNIEFWGQNYNNTNSNGVPNASGTIHDFGDQAASGAYGTLQVHNYGESQTILAYNNWGSNSGGTSDVGIGNNPNPPTQGATDWTFMGNAGAYSTRNLYVLARPGGVSTATGPVIRLHPCDRSVNTGANVTFSVTVDGAGPYTYQWRRNGAPLSGETAAWLELSAVTSGDAGSYDVVVTGPNLGSTTSLPGVLDINGSSSIIETWRIANGFDPSDGSGPNEGDHQDKDLDGLVNLLEFGFGTDPNANDSGPLNPNGSINGSPTLQVSGGAIAFFVRRDDHDSPGSLHYTPQFSSDLTTFYDSIAPPDFVADSTDDPAYEVVSLPFPTLLPDNEPARFFRLKVELVP